MQTDIESIKKLMRPPSNDYALAYNQAVYDMLNIIQKMPPAPVVDAGQLEKVIGDAFEAGMKRQYHELKKAYNSSFDWLLSEKTTPTQDQYIQQAIEQLKNKK